jgi:hypothetical protein
MSNDYDFADATGGTVGDLDSAAQAALNQQTAVAKTGDTNPASALAKAAGTALGKGLTSGSQPASNPMANAFKAVQAPPPPQMMAPPQAAPALAAPPGAPQLVRTVVPRWLRPQY